MRKKHHKIAVLIPYFQREQGILRAVVSAVLEQKSCEDFYIVIVDDESPVAASGELAALSYPEGKVKLILQRNAGPGAARNTALDNLAAETDYVAFVDSDDLLRPTYLADAAYALTQGYDLFFGNSERADVAGSRFEWQSGPGNTLVPEQHRLIDSERSLYEFLGDFFDFVVYRSNIIGPSTMMYRHSAAPEMRYDERIFNGQDRIFKLALCRLLTRVAFSTQIYACEGRGVNIFDSAGWGSKRSLSRLSSYIDMSKTILRDIPMNENQTAHVKRHLQESRCDYIASVLHQARTEKRVDWRSVIDTLRRDPGFAVQLAPSMLKVLRNKVGSS
jgi:succinoglycan biosynthesis protein ExoW